MKKLIVVLLFACMTLFSGVILSSCGEDAGNKTITVTDASGLTEIRIRDIGRDKDVYLEGVNGRFTVSYHANLKVEINASVYGVDFSNLVVEVNGTDYVTGNGIFDTNRDYDAYSPIAEKGSLYYGYFTLPYIESNVNIRISNVRKVSSIFTFEGENLEETQSYLQHTQINLNPNTEEYVNLYEFLSDETTSKSVAREYDYTLDPAENKYRAFKLKFDGVNPFEFNDIVPFSVSSGDKTFDEVSLVACEGCFIVDLGAQSIGEEEVYNIVVDFSGVTLRNFDVSLPEANKTFSVEASQMTVDILNVGDFALTLTKNMEDAVDEVTADYSEMEVLANGTALVFDEESGTYKFPENLYSPYETEFGGEVFDINVRGIKYKKGEEELQPIVLNCNLSDISITKESMNLRMHLASDTENFLPFGLDAEGNVIGLDGQKYVISWEFVHDEENNYHTVILPYDVEFAVEGSEDVLFNLSNVLPADNTDLAENVFTKQIGDDTLRATYNTNTRRFDKFELEFTCHAEPDEVEGDETQKSMSFAVKVKPYNKNLDLILGFDDDTATYEAAIYDASNPLTDWSSLSKNSPLTMQVREGQLIAIKITSSSEIDYSMYDIERQAVAVLMDGFEDLSKDSQIIYVIKFRVTDLYEETNQEFKLLKNYETKE